MHDEGGPRTYSFIEWIGLPSRPLVRHTQHGSFGGFGLLDHCSSNDEEYYAAGSDDFCAYLWRIPSVGDLKAAREISQAEQWYSEKSDEIGRPFELIYLMSVNHR